MAKIRDQIADVIKELTVLQNSPSPIPKQEDGFPLPSMIPAGSAGGIIVSKSIERTIAAVGETIKNDEKLNDRFGKEDWDRAVRGAFGEALITINLENDLADNADLVLSGIKKKLKKWEEGTRKIREHAFGCTFLNCEAMAPFDIGPARLERREDWLIRKKDAGEVSAVTYRRICKAWQGEKLKKRKTSKDGIDERNIIEAIKHCPFVCSVKTEALAQQISQDKSLMAARLAMVSVSLMWQQPSRALDGLNLLYDGPVYSQTSLTFVSGAQMLSGHKINLHPHGPYLKKEEWEKVLKTHDYVISAVGETLGFYLRPLDQHNRPEMMNALFHALLWFYEGCREQVTTLAIVKFASAMDALACGGKSSGILNLITTQLGKSGDDQLFVDGTTAQNAVEKIYNYARSRTLHGSNDKIGEDWSKMRIQAEQLTRLCLLCCLDYAGKNISTSDPAVFSGQRSGQ